MIGAVTCAGSIDVAPIAARSRERFAIADSDGDGAITPAEMTAALENAGRDTGRVETLFARMDANADGKIDAEEHEAMGKRLAQLHERLMARKGMPPRLNAFLASEDDSSSAFDLVG